MKKYFIYLLMVAAVVMLGGLARQMKTMSPKYRELKLPTSRVPIPILRVEIARFWLPISVGVVQHNVWHRKLSVRQEQIASASNRLCLILRNTRLAPKSHERKRTTMPVLPLPMKWKTGMITTRYSSVVPYGGGQLR